jgi:hypothetical protein
MKSEFQRISCCSINGTSDEWTFWKHSLLVQLIDASTARKWIHVSHQPKFSKVLLFPVVRTRQYTKSTAKKKTQK